MTINGETSETVQFTGILKLVSEAAHNRIKPSDFIEGVQKVFKDIDAAFADLKRSVSSIPSEEHGASYLELLLLEAEACQEIMHMALEMFKAYASGEEPLGLRIGVQLLEKGQKKFQELVSQNNAAASSNNLYNSNIAVCAAASEVLEGKILIDDFALSLEQLKAMFIPLEAEAMLLQQEIIKTCRSLTKFDSNLVSIYGRKVLDDVQRLGDAVGMMVLVSYSPDYVKQSLSSMLINKEVENSEE